jgi:hypothetical protein
MQHPAHAFLQVITTTIDVGDAVQLEWHQCHQQAMTAYQAG